MKAKETHPGKATPSMRMSLRESVEHLVKTRGGRTIAQTAERAGVSVGALHSILSGQQHTPAVPTLKNLAEYFGRSEIDRQLIFVDFMDASGHLSVLSDHTLQRLREVIKEGRQAGSSNGATTSLEERGAMPPNAQQILAQTEKLLREIAELQKQQIAEDDDGDPSQMQGRLAIG